MPISLYQVDAFTDRVFRGNPAAVCPLDAWLEDDTLQAIAAENNLSETAFFVGGGGDYALRWFTPTVEVELCGHATLATAFVLATELGSGASSWRFSTRSGRVSVRRDGDDVFVLDFPARQTRPLSDDALVAALGAAPAQLRCAEDGTALAVFTAADEVAALAPDMARLAATGRCVIATAPGPQPVDFVSRFFAPSHGIAEDPVTGSAHCTLAPYWAARIGKRALRARQISRRGGELFVTAHGERVDIAGRAALYLRGEISPPPAT